MKYSDGIGAKSAKKKRSGNASGKARNNGDDSSVAAWQHGKA